MWRILAVVTDCPKRPHVASSQLKRERSLPASFDQTNGNYHNISNTWFLSGFLSSSPTTPATLSVCASGPKTKQ
jgi:hypothetical protein